MMGCDGINASFSPLALSRPLTFSLIIGFCFSDFQFYIFCALGLIDKIGSTKGSLLYQLIQPNVAIYRGSKCPLQTFEVEVIPEKPTRQPPFLNSDKDRYGVTWCATWFSYNFMLPIHPPKKPTRTLVVPFGGARDATAQQLQEHQRKVWERPVGKKQGGHQFKIGGTGMSMVLSNWVITPI